MLARPNHDLPLNEQIASIDALGASAQQQKRERFVDLYEAVERALLRKTPVKELLAQLRQLGLNLSISTFNKMLEAERTEREAHGEIVHCKHCDSELHLSSQRSGHRESPSAGDQNDRDEAELDALK